MTLCERCKHRGSCTRLCPTASRYVCKDYVSLRERYSPKIDFFENQTSTGWERVQDAAYTPLPEYGFLRQIENDLLQAVYYEGASYAEAARRFHRKQNTVKSILARVRKKIASEFSYSVAEQYST
jgi:hypothetical protein